MDQFSYPVQCTAAQVLASASKVKRIQGHLQEAGEGCDCRECQLCNKGISFTCCWTNLHHRECQKSDLFFFPRATKKNMALS